MNAARLYTIETRITEEENSRMKEFNSMKDHYLKLLYTLEQKNVIQESNKAELTALLNHQAEYSKKLSSALPLIKTADESVNQSN